VVIHTALAANESMTVASVEVNCQREARRRGNRLVDSKGGGWWLSPTCLSLQSYARRCAASMRGLRRRRHRQKEKARLISEAGLANDSRQRPTLPHTCACSTIGGGRLNFRVRNGNGCDPAPVTTGKLDDARHKPTSKLRVRGPARRNAALSRVSSPCRSSRTISKSASLVTSPIEIRRAQLNILQTVALRATHINSGRKK
jgi:hypothetical protein